MLCQFTAEQDGDITLADLDYNFPKDVYPVGRLDKDSEGLLLLCNDGKLKAKLSNPAYKVAKTYWVQVEGEPSANAIAQIQKGVAIAINGKSHLTLSAQVSVLTTEPDLPPRTPPIRFRKSIPTTWLQITITEGKNRQVRRMTAAVSLPTLRLVRVGISNIQLNGLRPGEVREINAGSIVLP
jgi:23S rRNA pseudouridine2457 synthase